MMDLPELIALRASARFIIDSCDSGDVTRQKSEIVKEASSILTRVNQEFEALVNSEATEDDAYYVWSAEHSRWWKAGAEGYAKGLNDAGVYTRRQALDICRNAIPTSGSLGCMSEMPVRRADIIEFLKDQMIPGPLLNGDRR